MTTIAFQRETSAYWEQLKDASDQVKLALISLLSASLVTKDSQVKTVIDDAKPVIRPEDLDITPFVGSIGERLTPLPDDFDYQKACEEYLMQKYG